MRTCTEIAIVKNNIASFRSNNDVEKGYFEICKLMAQSSPRTDNSPLPVQPNDILVLTSNVITAEKLFYPNDEMLRCDATTKQPMFESTHGSKDPSHGRSGKGKVMIMDRSFK